MIPTDTADTPSRFTLHFPLVAAVVLQPELSGAIAASLALCVGLISIHYAMTVVILWLALFAFYLERRLLDYVIMPPFVIVTAWTALGLGLGVSLLVYASGGLFNRELAMMQGLHIALYPLMFAAYRFGFGKPPRMVFPSNSPDFEKNVIRPLVALGWILFGWRVIQLTVFAATGAEDRGYNSVSARFDMLDPQGAQYGVWTFFAVFPRLNFLGFVLFPLIWSRAGGLLRSVLLALLGFYLLLAFAGGSRGTFLYPLLFIGIGTFFFCRLRTIRLELVGIGLLAAMIPVITFMDHFRGTQTYQITRTLDLTSRLGAVTEAQEHYQESASGNTDWSNLQILGDALIGIKDFFIYRMTPSQVPYAGFEGFEAIPYTWLPSYLFRGKPKLEDGMSIMYQYLGEDLLTNITISTTADCYRRFGWLGVPVGVALTWFIYGWLCGKAYRTFLNRNALFGAMLILYAFSFFCGGTFSTLLATWWTVAYELPKHLLAFGFLYWLVTTLVPVSSRQGALAYALSKAPAPPPRQRQAAVIARESSIPLQ